MQPAHLLFLLSDEHSRDMTGCYGHPCIQTPHLDGLAARGARFTRACTPCPICVPARASLATGRWVHQIGAWDNAFPYSGAVPSWGHRLQDQGFQVVSIGKLHFRGPRDNNGFTQEIEPLHVVGEVGDLLGCLRERSPARDKREGIAEAGPGSSTYLEYDARIARHAVQWIEAHAHDERPWVLFVSFVCPHPPYIAPPRLFDLYPPDRLPLPPQWRAGEHPEHSELRWMREKFGYGEFDEPLLRKAIAAYSGAVTYLDERIGEVLGALERLGLTDRTRVMYSSDHGENLGARGLFGKFTMYEESVTVPLLLAGPDVPAGRIVGTPASLVDCFPTVLEAVGAEPAPGDLSLPGRSLWGLAAEPDRDREVVSEYHAVNSRRAIFMLRGLRYKYVHYAGASPQLFDLETDPHELRDLASDPAHEAVRQAMETRLRARLDPESVDAQARSDQHAKIEAHGGEAQVLRRGTFDNSPVPGETPAFKGV